MSNEWEDAPGSWEDAPDDDEGLIKKALGFGEGALSTASGLLASIPGGVAGLGTLATGGGLEGANKTLEGVSNALTYEPRTKTGQHVSETINQTLSDYQQEYANKFAGDAAYLTQQKKNPTASDYAAENTEQLVGQIIGGLYAPGLGGNLRARPKADPKGLLDQVQKKESELVKEKPKVTEWEDAPTNETRQLELLEPDNQGKMANPYEAQHGTWAVDENGMPVRTDISMEAANMEQPLQRNLWGDELAPRETPRGQAEGLPMDRDIIGHEQISGKDVSPEHIGITEAMDRTKREAMFAESLDEAVRKVDQVKEQVDSLAHDLKADPALERARMDSEVMTERSPYTDPILRRSPGGRQTGGVNPEMFRDTFEAVKKVRDYTMKLFGNEYGGPTVVLYDKAGKEIGELRTQAKWKGDERNLEADFVKVDHKHRGQGLAKEMYQMLSEHGNDIRKSDNLLDDGKALWQKFEQSGFAKDGIVPVKQSAEQNLKSALRQSARTHIGALGQGYVPLKQRGAVGHLNEGKKRTVVDDLKKRFEKEEGMIPENPDPKKVVADSLDEGKDSKQFNYTESGATLAAMKRASAAVEGAARIIQNAVKRADKAIRENVFPTERAFRKLSRDEITSLGAIMKQEMLQGKRFSSEALSSLSVKQQEAYAQMRHMFQDTLRIQNEARAAKGQEPITEMEAYLSSRWSGDFRRPVYQAVLDKGGNPVIEADGSIKRKLVYYLAAHSKRGLEKQWEVLKKEHPDFEFDPKKDHTVRYYKRETDLQSAYSTILDILGDDPEHRAAVNQISQALQEQTMNEAATFLGQEKHFKEKTGVRGFVGDRPGKEGHKEAIAMFQQQIQYAKNAYKWSELQKGAIDLKEIVSDKDLVKQQPNNVKYIKEYFKQNVGYGEAVAIAHLEDSIRNLGFSPTVLNAGVGTLKSAFILQKLAVNTGYTIANVIQTSNVLPHLAALHGQGIKGNPLTAIPVGITGGIAMALGHYANFWSDGKISRNIKGPEANFIQKAFKYAEDNGVTARALYDESPIETSFSKVGMAANALGKTMSVSEAFVRGMAYMTYVEYLRSSKKFKSDMAVFQKAEELTNASMVDYRRGERPMAFEKLGTIGNFLNTLQTYPVNWYNQWNYFGRQAAKGNVAPFVTALALQYSIAGAMGIPGFEDLDKLYGVIRDHVVSDTTYAKMRQSDFFTDPKMWMVKNFGQASVYGVLSDKTGWGLTSRVSAPGAGQMLQSPVGPIVDIAGQGANLASAAMDPTNKTKWAQVGMSSAPPGLQGLLETAPFMEGATWDNRSNPTTGQQERIYGRPGNVAEHLGVVTRNPEEETLRKFGLRSQREAVERELGYRTSQNTKAAEKKAKSIPDAMYDAAKRGDQKRVAELYDAYVKLTGSDISAEAWDAQIKQNYFTTLERSAMSAKSLTAIKDVARMNAIMEQVKNEYKQRR